MQDYALLVVLAVGTVWGVHRVNSYYLGDEAEVGADGRLLLQAERGAETKRVSQLVVEKKNKLGTHSIDKGLEDVLCGRTSLEVPTQETVAMLLLEAPSLCYQMLISI